MIFLVDPSMEHLQAFPYEIVVLLVLILDLGVKDNGEGEFLHTLQSTIQGPH